SKAIGHIDCSPKDRFFSYLPLCHIAERLLVEHGGIYSGGSIDFAQSLDTFADNLRAAKPTIFLGVPRIWSKFQQGVLAKQPQKKLDTLLKIPIISGIIKKKVKEALGLQEGRMLMTGAAPIPVATINWYKKLGIELLEAYAMTENTCYSHVTMPDKVQVGSVGQALPDCDCRIGEEDEIQIKHDALMIEYYKDPEQTKEAFTSDGYLRTGDSGSIDSQGFLRITGRVKDIFKTDKGKYISPAQIELKLSANTNIGQVCLVGTGIPQPIALVTLSEIGQKVSKEEVSKSLVETVKALNKTLGKHEIIKSVVCLPEEWTVENTCLTPTMKIKRKNVEAKHKDNYIKWYEDENFVVFPG
ncbi:MAG: long-chain acyl-CoA synthetase, partial [Limisphaerales bacterium]